MVASTAGNGAALSFRFPAFKPRRGGIVSVDALQTLSQQSRHGDYRVWLSAITVAGFLAGVTAMSLWRIWQILACCSGWSL